MELLPIPDHIKVAARLIGGPENTFFKICEGLELLEDKSEYPNSVFFRRDGEIIMELDTKNGNIYCSYKNVWALFENEYTHNYTDVQYIIKSLVEEHFKLRGVTPVKWQESQPWWWRNISN